MNEFYFIFWSGYAIFIRRFASFAFFGQCKSNTRSRYSDGCVSHSYTINFPLSAFFGTPLYYIWVFYLKTLWPTINSRQPQLWVDEENRPRKKRSSELIFQRFHAIIKYFNYRATKIIIHYHFKIHCKWQIGTNKRTEKRRRMSKWENNRSTKKRTAPFDCITQNDFHLNFPFYLKNHFLYVFYALFFSSFFIFFLYLFFLFCSQNCIWMRCKLRKLKFIEKHSI